MPTLSEQIETSLPLHDTFVFVSDFANSHLWDPGVETAARIGAGPVGVGARYRLGVRMGPRIAPMEYRVTTFEPPHRVVLAGSGSGVSAIDDIRFEITDRGTRVEYQADIRLHGLARLVEPFAGRTFRRIAQDARDGLQRTLDERAAARPSDGR